MEMLEYDKKWKREPYSEIKPEYYMIPHLGQRKLLIAEIEFIAEYSHLSNDVVYAGAGPGYHIVQLAELFPKKMFYLYDPREFAPELREAKNVKLFKEYFTDKTAALYKNSLFISDIRTSGSNFEEEVMYNMDQQRKWCEIMKPIMASLKFRFPFFSSSLLEERIEYFTGRIMLQPWVGRDSAETRLWTNCKKYKKYDPQEYTEQMFYYNKCLRLGTYNIGQLTWKKYKEVTGSTDILSDKRIQSFNIGPHGKMRDLPVEERVKALKQETLEFYVKYHEHEHKKNVVNKPTQKL